MGERVESFLKGLDIQVSCFAELLKVERVQLEDQPMVSNFWALFLL